MQMLGSRRFMLGLVGIACLTFLGLHTNDASVGVSIALIVTAVAGASAYQKKGTSDVK